MSGTLRFAAFAVLFSLLLAKVLSSGALQSFGGGQGAKALPEVGKALPEVGKALPGAGQAFAATVRQSPVNLPMSTDEVRIAANGAGQFFTDADVNGARIRRIVVDTGATFVVLSYEDAALAGFYPAPSDYKYEVMTANGIAHVARVRLIDVRIGNLAAFDVDAVVAERGALSSSLLGMSFLSKLRKFSVESGTLALRR